MGRLEQAPNVLTPGASRRHGDSRVVHHVIEDLIEVGAHDAELAVKAAVAQERRGLIDDPRAELHDPFAIAEDERALTHIVSAGETASAGSR